MRISQLLILFYLLLFLAACSGDRLQVDVSSVKVNIKIKRLDVDLFQLNPNNIQAQINSLAKDYGRFFDLYNFRIISLGNFKDPNYQQYLSYFLKDYSVNSAQKKVSAQFKDISEIEAKLTDAFKHYKFYFPEKPIPQMYTFISGFNQSIVTDTLTIGIGLDKYLGTNCEVYSWLGTDNYKRQKMYPEKIVSDCMYAWAATEFEGANINNLLHQMIYQGKLMYFATAMLPNEVDTVQFGYTDKQMKWCNKNEAKMWAYLVSKRMLFETKPLEIKKFVDEAPFTAAYGNLSPGKTGVWTGYRIVKSYMDKHPNISLKQLMLDTNYQQILTLSKYKP